MTAHIELSTATNSSVHRYYMFYVPSNLHDGRLKNRNPSLQLNADAPKTNFRPSLVLKASTVMWLDVGQYLHVDTTNQIISSSYTTLRLLLAKTTMSFKRLFVHLMFHLTQFSCSNELKKLSLTMLYASTYGLLCSLCCAEVQRKRRWRFSQQRIQHVISKVYSQYWH